MSTPKPFELPAPLPSWPSGTGFGTGTITLGEIEVSQVSTFAKIWSCKRGIRNQGATFYKPVQIPSGYFTLGYYSQPNSEPLHGWVLVAKEKSVLLDEKAAVAESRLPALEKPVDYTLVWNSQNWIREDDGHGYFWLPNPAEGYKAVGFVVTNKPQKPSLEEVRCVRSDLTDASKTDALIWDTGYVIHPFSVWNMRPQAAGVQGRGICVGTFYCNNARNAEDALPVACLKNVNLDLGAMPNLRQVHSIIENYGPTVFCHPHEIYFPSSVSWYFENGALLHKKGETTHQAIAADGSNLPQGGSNDGEYWLELPEDIDRATKLKHGDLQSAEAYAHVKPMLGGTFTDIAMWVFYPFNGPSTAKIGLINLPLGKTGQHVGDWEHVTLRVSNFTGELWRVYFSKHSAGVWVNASQLEYVEGNKSVVYSSKNGHANFPHAGLDLQGSDTARVGIRNDTARSNYSLDMSRKYQVVAAEYLVSVGSNEIVSEPPWLNYFRQWGPNITYDSAVLLGQIDILPNELSGEKGPTGPKMKINWNEDETE
eukprot:Gb_30275 [translate_table: standard]